MSTHFRCDDTETLVAYLYDDIDPVLRDVVARHLPGCTRCRDEIAALGGVRQALSEWAPPTPALRFTVVPESAVLPVAPPPVTAARTVPLWAQAIAATLALAVSASIANVQVRRDAAGWTVTTGWMTPAVAAPATATAAGADATPWQPALASLEETLRRELAARPAAAPSVATTATSTAASDSETLARVRALIDASEKRQEQELALRLAQFGRDVDLQRRADLVKIDQGIGQLEGRTGAEVARQRDAINLLIRAGLRPQQ